MKNMTNFSPLRDVRPQCATVALLLLISVNELRVVVCQKSQLNYDVSAKDWIDAKSALELSDCPELRSDILQKLTWGCPFSKNMCGIQTVMFWLLHYWNGTLNILANLVKPSQWNHNFNQILG